MTADEFVKALKRAAKGHKSITPETPFLKEREAAIRAWAGIKRLRRKPQDDPVLDLIDRYELTGVVIHQLVFRPESIVDQYGMRLVATQCTHDYYVERGMILVMYYKEAFPGPTEVTSSEFLELLALRARMIAAFPIGSSQEVLATIEAEHAQEALTMTPFAARFNFFGEERAKFEAAKKRYSSQQPHETR